MRCLLGFERERYVNCISLIAQIHLARTANEIIQLSKLLIRLGGSLFPAADRASTFRNESGVYMKPINFRSLDPEYTAAGKIGLSREAKAATKVVNTKSQ